MSVWSKPIECLEFQDVVAFCAEQHPESERLEYKERFSTKSENEQVAKEVCALANHQGGIIIFGVEEHPTKRSFPSENPEGRDLGGDPRDAISKICTSRIFPWPRPDVSPYLRNPQKPDQGFVVVRVAASPEAPLSLQERKGVYIRVRYEDRCESRQATVDEMEYMIERRKARISLQQERVRRGMEQLWRASVMLPHEQVEPGQPHLTLAIGPVIMDQAMILDGAEIRKSPPYRGYPERMLDGAYAIGDVRWLADVFGNLVATFPASQLVRSVSGEVIQDHRWEGRPGEKLQAISSADLCGRVGDLLDVAKKWYAKHDYFGRLRFHVRIAGLLRTVVLHQPANHPFATVLAKNSTDATLTFAVDLSTEHFSPDIWPAAKRVAGRILEGWGFRADQSPDAFVCKAMTKYDGDTRCPVHNLYKPRVLTRCLKCLVESGDADVPPQSF